MTVSERREGEGEEEGEEERKGIRGQRPDDAIDA